MHIIAIVAVCFNIVAVIIMLNLYVKRSRKHDGFYNRNTKYSVDEVVEQKNSLQLLIYIGASGGILFWSTVIGAIVSIHTMDLQRLYRAIEIGSTLAFIPSVAGLLKAYKINSKQR